MNRIDIDIENDREFKRKVHEHLVMYREENGLGCFVPLSKASGLSDSVLRDLYLGEPHPIAIWKKLNAGLTRLQRKNIFSNNK